MSRSKPPMQPPAESRTLESIVYDFDRYQKLLDTRDLRGWAADQLHENLRWLLNEFTEHKR